MIRMLSYFGFKILLDRLPHCDQFVFPFAQLLFNSAFSLAQLLFQSRLVLLEALLETLNVLLQFGTILMDAFRALSYFGFKILLY